MHKEDQAERDNPGSSWISSSKILIGLAQRKERALKDDLSSNEPFESSTWLVSCLALSADFVCLLLQDLHSAYSTLQLRRA